MRAGRERRKAFRSLLLSPSRSLLQGINQIPAPAKLSDPSLARSSPSSDTFARTCTDVTLSGRTYADEIPSMNPVDRFGQERGLTGCRMFPNFAVISLVIDLSRLAIRDMMRRSDFRVKIVSD